MEIRKSDSIVYEITQQKAYVWQNYKFVKYAIPYFLVIFEYYRFTNNGVVKINEKQGHLMDQKICT